MKLLATTGVSLVLRLDPAVSRFWIFSVELGVPWKASRLQNGTLTYSLWYVKSFRQSYRYQKLTGGTCFDAL